METYLLAIAPQVQTLLFSIGGFLAIAGLVGGSLGSPEYSVSKQDNAKFRRYAISACVCGMILCLAASLIPTRKALIEEHLLLEGRGLATEQAARDVAGKIDEYVTGLLRKKGDE